MLAVAGAFLAAPSPPRPPLSPLAVCWMQGGLAGLSLFRHLSSGGPWGAGCGGWLLATLGSASGWSYLIVSVGPLDAGGVCRTSLCSAAPRGRAAARLAPRRLEIHCAS